MEELRSAVFFSLGAFFLLFQAWRFLKWSWLDPKRLEKRLRQMGFRGNPYRFVAGDYKEIAAEAKEALAKPIPLLADVAPRVIPSLHRAIAEHGPNSFLWFGPIPGAIVTDPEMIREILSKTSSFHKMSVPYGKLLAQGLAAAEDEHWARLRALINPAFHLDKLKGMLPAFKACCAEMLAKWKDEIGEAAAAEVDVWPHLQTLSSDAISRTAFGSNYEEGRRVFQLQKELGAIIIEALRTLYIPGSRFIPTKRNRKMVEMKKEIESIIMGIISKRLRAIETGEAPSESTDLLGILLESYHTQIQQNGNGGGIGLKDVIDECKLFYIAGQETTSSLVVWTMILLAQHRSWQERARDEVLQVVGSSSDDEEEDIGFHQLNQLKVLNMILHEVLRLYPPGVILSRTVHKETTVKNVTLPVGVQIFMPTIVLQQDTNVWGENAKEFEPERFRDGIYSATKGKLTYFPFGNGPRTCIGQNFAMLEAKMTLAMILRRFSFEISPTYAHAPEIVLILQPQFGAQLLLRRIPAGGKP